MYLRGALVSFMPTKLIPIPNVIVFQFNPETMTHTWTQAEAVAPAAEGKPKTNPLAVKGFPGEQFSFTIAVDAGDTIADGAVSAALAEVSGVYTRLAAMEMLMFPASATQDGLLGTVTAAILPPFSTRWRTSIESLTPPATTRSFWTTAGFGG